ncbi:MAG: serine/threonine-protein kinase, partial [Myxococcota bacterium]|nr:serine/threonine-protein kinase [Myxococcota bacterium]
EICAALEVAHRRKVVHRDIKPANIFLHRANGELESPVEVRLLDFGIAKVTEGLGHTPTGMAIGSLYYMSPEQIQDSSKVNGQSDLYSLGITAWQLLSGELPYHSTSQFEILRAHLEDPLPAISRTLSPLAEALFMIIQEMTAKEVDARSASATGVIERLHSLSALFPQLGDFSPEALLPPSLFHEDSIEEISTEEPIDPFLNTADTQEGHPAPRARAPQILGNEHTILPDAKLLEWKQRGVRETADVLSPTVEHITREQRELGSLPASEQEGSEPQRSQEGTPDSLTLAGSTPSPPQGKPAEQTAPTDRSPSPVDLTDQSTVVVVDTKNDQLKRSLLTYLPLGLCALMALLYALKSSDPTPRRDEETRPLQHSSLRIHLSPDPGVYGYKFGQLLALKVTNHRGEPLLGWQLSELPPCLELAPSLPYLRVIDGAEGSLVIRLKGESVERPISIDRAGSSLLEGLQ